MIDSRFVYLAMFLSLVGAYGYIRDTLRGTTSPHRVTWALWALEGVLAFIIEIQQHVGSAALMTLMLGFVPLLVLGASFANSRSVWHLGRFDLVCAALSLLGLVFWGVVHQATVALVSFVAADQIAALPTVRKSWLAPESESPRLFFLGALNCALTLMTLHHLTTAGVIFPGCIMIGDVVLASVIATRVGPRVRMKRSSELAAAR